MNAQPQPLDTAVEQATAAPPATPYERMGGDEAVRKLVNRFYDLMESSTGVTELREMHAPDLNPMREKLFDFLSGWLGGPPRYFQRADSKCMGSAHQPFAITAAARDQWLACFFRALDDVGVDVETRNMLRAPITRMAESFRNR